MMRNINWRMRMRNNKLGYIACSQVYHDAINDGRAEWYAEKLADQKADKIQSARAAREKTDAKHL
ncbi:MAG: hypothetical protein LAT55_12995 [Opitutales bacterium]|nr:hypothetical protein [Opitutales bacterium]